VTQPGLEKDRYQRGRQRDQGTGEQGQRQGDQHEPREQDLAERQIGNEIGHRGQGRRDAVAVRHLCRLREEPRDAEGQRHRAAPARDTAQRWRHARGQVARQHARCKGQRAQKGQDRRVLKAAQQYQPDRRPCHLHGAASLTARP
jgi:hypothetical protein